MSLLVVQQVMQQYLQREELPYTATQGYKKWTTKNKIFTSSDTVIYLQKLRKTDRRFRRSSYTWCIILISTLE